MADIDKGRDAMVRPRAVVQQRMVEIRRTLMSEPKMLLVDEPTAGLSKMLAAEAYEILRELSTRDRLTILLGD